MLFSNPTIASLMNEAFVPHWVNVRDAPKVTIDFGEGRVLERTLNGNIATYICLPNGQTLDVITGLNDEATYLRRLREGLELYRALRKRAPTAGARDASLPDQEEARRAVLSYHEVSLTKGHAAGLEAVRKGRPAGSSYGFTTVSYEGDLSGVARYEETHAMTKAVVEGPLKRAIAIDPGLPAERLPAPQDPFARLRGLVPPPEGAVAKGVVERPLKRALRPVRPLAEPKEGELRDAVSKSVVEAPLKGALEPLEARDHLSPSAAKLVREAKPTLDADSRHNETTRRLQIHRLLLLRPLQLPSALAKVVYKEVMHVDLSDPFLGLAPMVVGGEIGRHGASEK